MYDLRLASQARREFFQCTFLKDHEPVREIE